METDYTAQKALHEALSFAKANLYTTNGRAWREIIASLGFEAKADLSLIQYFDEQEQARFQTITQAFADRQLEIGEIIDIYLEFFPRPEQW